MATVTTNIHNIHTGNIHAGNVSGGQAGFRAAFGAFFAKHFSRRLAAFGRGFTAYGDRHSRREQIAALYAKSDAQLAAMGLAREDILRYVFRDLYYI